MPRISAASGHRPPRRAYRAASRGMDCRRYHSAARRCTSRIVRGWVIPSTQHVRDQPVQSVPATAGAHGVDEQVRRSELGQGLRTGPRAGQRVGQVGADEVDGTNPHQEIEQLRSQPVDHLAEQIGGHRVVVTGERVDEPGGILAALQLERGQPETGRPPFRPLDQATDMSAVEVDPELRQQRGRLIHPEGELSGPDLGEHPGEAESVQRPRRISARRHHKPKPLRWALHQAQQALVNSERGDLMQIVHDQDDRRSVARQDLGNPSRHSLHSLVRHDLPEVRGRLLTDHRGDRGRDRRPQCPHLVIRRAERDPGRGPACFALGQPRTGQQRLPPARGRGDQRAGELQTRGHPCVQPGTGHELRGDRHGELAVPVRDTGGGRWVTAVSHPGRMICGHPDAPTISEEARRPM